MIVGHFALMVAALFAGAAFYVSFAEQPARLGLDDRALLAEWKPAYRRGFAMQAPLALIGFILGTVAWRTSSRPEFLAGALSLLATWPWTLLAMMSINQTLMKTVPEAAGPQTRSLIVKWSRLHLVRTALGFLAVILFLSALWPR
jgi:hypothetical protein